MNFLKPSVWTTEMNSFRDNLMKTIVMDEKILENRGNDFKLLKSLIAPYRRPFPAVAHLKEQQWKQMGAETDSTAP